MSKMRSTVVVEKDERRYKLFKVWFGADGSYYVTVPYHTARSASFEKRTVRYDTPFGAGVISPIEAVVDVAILEDDDGRVKLSHHPDGFCQFSGQGVLSGKDDKGRVKGMGVMARAFRNWASIRTGLHCFGVRYRRIRCLPRTRPRRRPVQRRRSPACSHSSDSIRVGRWRACPRRSRK